MWAKDRTGARLAVLDFGMEETQSYQPTLWQPLPAAPEGESK